MTIHGELNKYISLDAYQKSINENRGQSRHSKENMYLTC